MCWYLSSVWQVQCFGRHRWFISQSLFHSEKRKRFNSLRSLIDSGGFLLGPAAAGALFMIGTPAFAIYANAAALVLSGMVTLLMPNLDTKTEVKRK